MAKNKKKPQQQLLSPENYIRQKARSLPVYECRINSNWEETGTPEILIVRAHANGNLTLGLYNIDLYCLGVKDVHYRFNITMAEYEELLGIMSKSFIMEKATYSLVHNIILTAVEYGAELGFKPHKDYTAVAQYLLEEDTDDIELIDIACGREGRPLFVQDQYMTDVEAKRIIAQLEKAVGEDNFDVILEDDIDFDEEIDEEIDESWGLAYEYNEMIYEEKKNLFFELTKNGLDDISDEEKSRLTALTDSFYYMDICDDDVVDSFIDLWLAELEMEIDEEEYSAELLSQEAGRIVTEEEALELDEIDFLINNKPRKARGFIRKLKEKWGNIPYLNYRELRHYENNNRNEYDKIVDDYCAQYSEFALFKIHDFKRTLMSTIKVDDIEVLKFEDVFGGRSSISETEMLEFQIAKALALIARGETNEIEAVYNAIDDLELNEVYYKYLKTILTLARINLLGHYLHGDVLQRNLNLKDLANMS